MARWITLHKAPFNFEWPGRTAVTVIRATGEHYVKDELADKAIATGYASEGKASEPKPAKSATTRRRGATKAKDASHSRKPARVDRADLAADDRADDSATVADAG
jgi:hypothetical protein